MPNKFSGQFLCKGFETRQGFEPLKAGKYKQRAPSL